MITAAVCTKFEQTMDVDTDNLFKRMPKLIDMSTATFYPMVSQLPEHEVGYTSYRNLELGDMEGLKKFLLSAETLDEAAVLGPLRGMDYEDDCLPFHDSMDSFPRLTPMDLSDDNQSVFHNSGYHDTPITLTELTKPYSDLSPVSSDDAYYEPDLSDSSGSETGLESPECEWVLIGETTNQADTLPLPAVCTLFSRALPPPPTDDFLGQGQSVSLVKEEMLDSSDESLDNSIDGHFDSCVNHWYHPTPSHTYQDQNNNNLTKSHIFRQKKSSEFSGSQEKLQRKKPGRKKGQVSKVLHLWEFIRDLLADPDYCPRIINWEDTNEGVFRVIQSSEVARLWGEKKHNKKTMTYEKLSRSLRYSRREGYFDSLPKDKGYPKKLCFKFGPKSHGWQEILSR